MEKNKTIKSAHLGKYLDQLDIRYVPFSMIGDIFNAVMNDGVNKLLLHKEEYDTIKRWLVALGMWNWDGKTFMSVELEVI